MSSREIEPRLFDRSGAARYLGVSAATVDRLLQAGLLQPVRLPVTRERRTGRGKAGRCRRILLDRRELDQLVDVSKERA